MIMMETGDGRYSPMLICDVCRKPIRDAGMAAAVSRLRLGRNDPDLVPVLHVHKGACHDAADQMCGGKWSAGWAEMESHLIQLCHNAGAPVDKLAEQDARVGRTVENL